MRAVDFHVCGRVIIDADAPIDDAVRPCVDRRVRNAVRARNLQGADRIAIAVAREAGGLGLITTRVA